MAQLAFGKTKTMRKKSKTAAGKSAAGKSLTESNDELSPKMLSIALASIAESEGYTPTAWVRRSQELWKARAKTDAIEEKWDEALADCITVDGFYCVMNDPSIHVIAIKQGELVYYDGETLQPVDLLEALRILEGISDAAQWFMVEPWNGGECTFSGNAAWYSKLRRVLGTALQMPKAKGGAR